MNGSQDQQNIQKHAQNADPPIGIETEETKQCTKCKRVLAITEFWVNRRRGRVEVRWWCKDCSREYRRKNDKEMLLKDPDYFRNQIRINKYKNIERARERNRNYWKRNKDEINKKQREFYKKNKHKARARTILNKAIKSGDIIRPVVCEICKENNQNIVGHHTDYSKPLDVVWVCKRCHSVIHNAKSIELKKIIEAYEKSTGNSL